MNKWMKIDNSYHGIVRYLFYMPKRLDITKNLICFTLKNHSLLSVWEYKRELSSPKIVILQLMKVKSFNSCKEPNSISEILTDTNLGAKENHKFDSCNL